MEQIVPGSIVAVGKKEQIRAVVCTIRPKRIEVVYLDAIGKALHQEVEWHAGAGSLSQAFRMADQLIRILVLISM